MSKIEANKFDLSIAEFNFEKLLQKTVNVINSRVEEKQQIFNVFLDRNIPPALEGDDQRVTQVITNLLSNAVKFTPEQGSIRLEARLVKEEADICTIQVSVTDSGIGMSEEQQSRLFSSFQQADSSISRRFGGTGLGLAISKRIVEMMEGSIWATSKPGEGSVFSFTIQIKRCGARGIDGAAEERNFLKPGLTRKNLHILAVDDDPDIRDYFSGILDQIGVAGDTAGSGEEALELIKTKGPYDLYFVDWKMPGLDGIELSRRITGRSPLRDSAPPDSAKPVVIMISAVDWNTVEGEAKQAGVSKFLSKPLFVSGVADIINECLGEDDPSSESNDGTDNFKGYRILLAEDMEINREIVIALLEPTQVEIDCAENGAEAVRMFGDHPEKYDFIFMDVHMPEMDGYEATRRIRALESSLPPAPGEPAPQSMPSAPAPHVPIVAMTANVFSQDIEKCLESGMDAHVGKPLDFSEVLAKLRQYLPASPR
jgi:CheY-like chemotaxis protein/anti-sigma regulatory factor (Ser/Thr protein kinase)